MTTVRKKLTALLALVLVCAGGALTACGSSAGGPVQVSASSIVPLDDLHDWVTYGDYFAEMTVVSERRVEPNAEQKEAGEGVIGRVIKVRVTDPTWKRPSLRKGLVIPKEFETGGGFWVFKGDKEMETEVEGRPWLSVGDSFYALFAYVDPELHTNPKKPASAIDPQWGPLLYLPTEDGRISKLDADAGEPALAAVSGKTPQEVGSMLAETEPDPKAAQYMDEDPALRAEHVATKN